MDCSMNNQPSAKWKGREERLEGKHIELCFVIGVGYKLFVVYVGNMIEDFGLRGLL